MSNWLARVAVNHVLRAWGFESLPAHVIYTVSDLLDKIEYEGGPYEAIVMYGIKPSDLDDSVPQVVKAMISAYAELGSQLSRLEDQLIKVLEECNEDA